MASLMLDYGWIKGLDLFFLQLLSLELMLDYGWIKPWTCFFCSCSY